VRFPSTCSLLGKRFVVRWKERLKATKSVVVGQSIISLVAMEGIANKLREGKMKRSAGVPTVILVRRFLFFYLYISIFSFVFGLFSFPDVNFLTC
jgi:hypothetical protein